MDKNLDIWILECNRNPNLEAAGEVNRLFALGFCKNILEILHEHQKLRYISMRNIIMNKIFKEIKHSGNVSEETTNELLGSFLNQEV